MAVHIMSDYSPDKLTSESDIARLSAGIQAVLDLINESEGVAGLHRNGDVAPWDELRTGGRFEEWLEKFDAAADLLRNKP